MSQAGLPPGNNHLSGEPYKAAGPLVPAGVHYDVLWTVTGIRILVGLLLYP